MTALIELCAGGGGVAHGLRDIAIPVAAVELEAPIAEVHRANVPGCRMYCQSVTTMDPLRYEVAGDGLWLHASPSCKNASQANSGAGETDEDRSVARAIARHIRVLRPSWFSLENVRKYRKFKSFGIITDELRKQGYDLDDWMLNSANYGVPQTRERLWLLASRENRVIRPVATHRRGGDWFHAPWNGWYGAITDLVDTLPESQFAPWQIERLTRLDSSFLVSNQRGTGTDGSREAVAPRYADEPSRSITTTYNPRAFLLSSQSVDMLMRRTSEPAHTVVATAYMNPARAFIVDDQNGGAGADGLRGLTIRTDDEPMFTVSATQSKRSLRAWLETGRTVALTPRAGARLQSFADTFVLPERNALAWTVIGNACCPNLMPHIAQALGVPVAQEVTHG